MKKLLLFTIFFGFLAAQNTVTVMDTSSQPGDTIPVRITLTNSNPVGGIQFSLHFDHSVASFVDFLPGDNLPQEFSISYNDTGDSVNVMIVSFSGDSILPGDREILRVVFRVNSAAVNGDSTVISASNLVISSPSGGVLSGTFNPGVLRVFETPRVFITILTDTTGSGMRACVPVNLSNVDFVGGFQFAVLFNSSKLTFDSIVSGLPQPFSLSFNTFQDSVTILGVSLSGDSLSPGDWTVGYLWFTVQISVLPDDSLYLNINSVIVSDPSAHPIPAQGISGYVGIFPDPPSLIEPQDSSIFNYQNLRITWSSVIGGQNYNLQIALDTSFTDIVDSIWTNDTIYMFTPAFDTTYYVRVRASSMRGYTGNWSDMVRFTIDTQAPASPQLINPTGGEWITAEPVQFEWTPVMLKSTPVWYIIELQGVITDTVDTAFYELTLPEGHYLWRVKAFDLAGNQSDWSLPDSFGVDMTPPSIDSVTGIADTNMFFGPWDVHAVIVDTTSGVENAWLFYRYSETRFDSTAMSGSGGNRWTGTIPALSDSATRVISYFIKAHDYAGFESVSDTFSFNVVQIDETPENTLKIGSIRSLGSRVMVTFVVPHDMQIQLRCFDVTGRVELEKILNLSAGRSEHEFRLSAGIHFIEIRHTKGVIRSRFVSF